MIVSAHESPSGLPFPFVNRYNFAMPNKPLADDLPLRYRTPDEWAHQALSDTPALLNDHAHLEKKAGANALDLLCRWPEPNPPAHWVQAMTNIARDEVEHLGLVTRLIARRGGKLTKSHKNPYAAALRKLVRLGRGDHDLMDRLMVSALIEARSCERFELLAQAGDDKELSKLFSGLWASEHGHYRVFIDLALRLHPKEAVDRRWSEMLDAEAGIIAEQPPGPRIHSGLA